MFLTDQSTKVTCSAKHSITVQCLEKCFVVPKTNFNPGVSLRTALGSVVCGSITVICNRFTVWRRCWPRSWAILRFFSARTGMPCNGRTSERIQYIHRTWYPLGTCDTQSIFYGRFSCPFEVQTAHFEQIRGTTIESGLYEPTKDSRLHGMVGASPDGKVLGPGGAILGLVEFKAPIFGLYAFDQHPPYGIPDKVARLCLGYVYLSHIYSSGSTCAKCRAKWASAGENDPFSCTMTYNSPDTQRFVTLRNCTYRGDAHPEGPFLS